LLAHDSVTVDRAPKGLAFSASRFILNVAESLEMGEAAEARVAPLVNTFHEVGVFLCAD
jgi:hypothetical protein